jgi:hypothetical protein
MRSLFLLTTSALPFVVGCSGLDANNPDGRVPDTEPVATDSGTPGTGTDSGIETDPNLLPLNITSISPAHGSVVGGTQVEIDGSGPFNATAQVWFGTQPASVIGIGPTRLRVQAPAGAQGLTSVRVTTDTHTARVDDAFRYWPDGQGLAGVIGELSHIRFVGTYWSPPAPSAEANVMFIAPAPFNFWELWGSGMDSCSSTYTFSGGLSVFVPDVDRFTLRRGTSSAINLNRDPDPSYDYWFEADDPVGQYANNATYDLSSDGGNTWPAFTLAGALRTPASFTVTEPAISGTTAPTVPQNFRLSWSGSDGDYMLARIIRYQAGAVAQTVDCVLTDDGTHQLNGSEFTGWNSGSQLLIMVGRVRTGSGTLPYNRASTEMVGIQWIVGAGWQQ